MGINIVSLKYLKKEEWVKLRNSVFNLRDSIILDVLYETGCSVSELSDIKASDVHSGFITVNSRKSYISSSLYSKILTFFELEKKQGDFLLDSRESEKITEKRIIQIVKYYSGRVGKSITPQILRYTHIVHAYEKNIPIDTIISQIGLKKSRMVQILSQFSIETQKDAYSRFYEQENT